MSPNEARALSALAEAYSEYEDFCFLSFSGIAGRSGLDPKLVRRTVRSLARKGFARYQRGLWTEDGEMAGSGYCCTKEGLSALISSAPSTVSPSDCGPGSKMPAPHLTDVSKPTSD